jgi:hypothetical protein
MREGLRDRCCSHCGWEKRRRRHKVAWIGRREGIDGRHKCVYHFMSAPHSKKLWSYRALTRETHSNMHLKSGNINHETTGKILQESTTPSIH